MATRIYFLFFLVLAALSFLVPTESTEKPKLQPRSEDAAQSNLGLPFRDPKKIETLLNSSLAAKSVEVFVLPGGMIKWLKDHAEAPPLGSAEHVIVAILSEFIDSGRDPETLKLPAPSSDEYVRRYTVAPFLHSFMKSWIDNYQKKHCSLNDPGDAYQCQKVRSLLLEAIIEDYIKQTEAQGHK